jgi:hypothetical protein
MSNCLRTLCLGTCLLLTSRFLAQPGLALPVLNQVAVGADVQPAVSVTGFSNLASAQFVVTWNPQVLDFQGVQGFNLPDLDESDFGLAETAQGTLRFGWAGSGAGAAVSNGAPLFQIRFRVVGANLSGSALQITESSPTAFELIQVENGQFVPYGLSQTQVLAGFVAVGYTVADAEPKAAAALPLRVLPNPFHDVSAAVFQLADAAEATLMLCDAAGRLLHTERHWLSAGPQTIELAASQFPASGTYFLTVRTAAQSCTQPLFFL